MNKTGKVYKITSPSGRIYIGSTRMDIKKRWKKYNSKQASKQVKIYNSIQKYGINNHVFEIIWEGDVKDMLKMERLMGEKYETLSDNGLNLKLPGYDDVPIIFSEEVKKKDE
jgi:group I intron endonuclease